jgi:hypothetical protein
MAGRAGRSRAPETASHVKPPIAGQELRAGMRQRSSQGRHAAAAAAQTAAFSTQAPILLTLPSWQTGQNQALAINDFATSLAQTATQGRKRQSG